MTFEGRTYLAIASPDREGEAGDYDGPDLMRLVAVDRRDVLEITGGMRVPVVEIGPARDAAEGEPMRAEPREVFTQALRSLGADEVIRRLINPAAPRPKPSRRPSRRFGKAVTG